MGGELGRALADPARHLAIERREASGVRPVAVFRFLSGDWSPWIALPRMRECWPEFAVRDESGVFADGDERGGGFW